MYEDFRSPYKNVRKRLNSTTEWEDAQGIVHALGQLDDNHLENIILWLEDKADELRECVVAECLSFPTHAVSSHPDGKLVFSDLKTAVRMADRPVEWVTNRPIYRALVKERRRRQLDNSKRKIRALIEQVRSAANSVGVENVMGVVIGDEYHPV